MWNRGGRSSALERAQAQLSERRITKSSADSKDNPGRYVAKGRVKTHGDPLSPQGYMDTIANRRNTSQARQTPFQDLSDLSLSLEDSVSKQHPNEITDKKLGRDDPPAESFGAGWGSRFLKKAPPPAAVTSQPPALSRTQTQPVEPKYVTTYQRSSQSAALSRLALIENRIRNRQQARDGPALSADRSTPPATQERETPLSSQSSSDLSMKGKRFLKKTANSSPTPAVAPKEKGPDLYPMPLGGSKAPIPPIRVASRGVTLDSDEEDMRKLLGGSFESSEDSLHKEARVSSQTTTRKSFVKRSQKVSPSPPLADWPSSVRALSRSPPFPQRLGSPRCFSSRTLAQHSPSLSIRSASVVLSPSPSPPNAPSPGRQGSPQSRLLRRSRSSVSALSEVRSLEELFPEALGSLEELFPEALGSLAELYPEDLPSDDATSEKSGVSDEFKINIMSLDDLAPVVTLGMYENKKKKKKETKAVKHKDPAPRSFIEEVSGEEQIPSEEPREDYESDFESEIRTETDRSRVSEISKYLGDGDKDVSEVSEVRDCIVSDTSRRDKYSSVSEGDSHVTHTDYSRTADSFSGRSSSGSYSRSLSRSHSMADTITPSSVSKRRSPSRRSVREAAVQTQPDGLAYTWSSGMAALGPAVGMAYVDPTPVASHTVSAEAVEALSAYSPAVFALNDMLRQQLALTKHFVQTSRHLHSSLLQSLGPADYTYTTLEDTKEFIRCHKPPQLTMEEALEEVLQEMREYHYI